MTSRWPVARFQNNFTSVFLLYPFAKIAKMVLLCWIKWLPELKIEEKKRKTLKDRISRWTKWLLKNIWTFFLLMAFWKSQHFNLVLARYRKNCLSHCLVISFNIWQYWKNVACHHDICSGVFTEMSELWLVGLLFIFPRKKDLTLHANGLGDNLHEVSDPVF